MSMNVDILTRLYNLLPTGPFLTFPIVVPLASNNGNCGLTEVILMSVSLAVLSVGCILTNFTDSYISTNGTVYNGFVTTRGLWVPGYDRSEMVNGSSHDEEAVTDSEISTCLLSSSKFIDKAMSKPHLSDYTSAVLSVTYFLTLTVFTAPVSSCYNPRMLESLLKTLPLVLASLVSFFCSFSGTLRHGIGFALPRYMPSTSTSTSSVVAPKHEPVNGI